MRCKADQSECSGLASRFSACLIFEDTVRDFSATAAPYKFVDGAVERHPTVEQRDVQVQHKAQDISRASTWAEA